MKKLFWVSADPFDEAIVTAAIEAGADAVAVPKGRSQDVRRLGRIRTIAEDGDLQWGRDLVRVRIASKADEERIDGRLPTVIENADWTVLPLENLLARTSNLIQTVYDAEQAAVALQVMERGADGIFLVTRDPEQVRRTGRLIQGLGAEEVALEPVRVAEVRPVTLSDRCCIDTTSLLPPGLGLLVGDAASALFLVHNENLDSPYAAARPFRVNAGAVHAYVRLPGDRTRYLCELSAGDEVLAVDSQGHTRAVAVGRNKIERRPMLLVAAASTDGRRVSLVLQNAETVRLTTPEGGPAPVTLLEPGDEVLAAFSGARGRHFGRVVDETVQER